MLGLSSFIREGILKMAKETTQPPQGEPALDIGAQMKKMEEEIAQASHDFNAALDNLIKTASKYGCDVEINRMIVENQIPNPDGTRARLVGFTHRIVQPIYPRKP